MTPVSYTHLDVYKRQVESSGWGRPRQSWDGLEAGLPVETAA